MVNLPQFDTLKEHKLQELLNHPAVQAGLAPFLAALIAAELFQRIKLSGLAVIAGFAATVYLASDFSIVPLTATRKIILLGSISATLGILLGLIRLSLFTWLLPVLGGAAAVWTAQRVLQQQEPQIVLLWGAGCAAYVAALVWGMDMLENQSPRAAAAATALGIGTGGAALVGASALLGQFGLALGSAAAAHLLIQMTTNRTLPAGRMFTLPLAMIAGLTGCIAVLSARTPWYALAILACIPIVARLAPLRAQSVRIQSLLLTLLTFACAGGAVYLTWRVAGDVPF
ncbi:MAG: hypothetical protein A2V79_01495 [Betaproteobacteria bacterium RBG_16_56_24]|nr:MAG: hypothetical protein A2V79_01495 [Betaproteobacteria bacterium RBG_16_56_24]